MHILFIHTFDYYEPLGIMALSALLKKHGHSCELLDLKFEKNYVQRVKEIKPDIVAYTITTNIWKHYQTINLEIKKHYKVLSIFGGPHCTFFPDFIKEEGVDIICRGEGEMPMLELANALETGGNINDIKNLWIKTEKGISKNEIRPLIDDLDVFPFHDRELINKYNHYRKRSRVRTITSRGCPYNCSYCFNHAYREMYRGMGKQLRRRSPENVIAEVKQLKEIYHPVNIEFHDDVFVLDLKWLQQFLALYRSEKIEIPFEANVRADLVTPKLVQMLKEGGCYSVQFGIESGNEKIRNQLLNRNISDEQIINSAALFRKAGIKMNIFNILGLPGETVEECFDTIKLNQICKPNYAMNTIFHPYPQTRLAEISMKNGTFDGNFDNFHKSIFYGGSVLNSKHKKQIMRLHFLFPFAVAFPWLMPVIKLLIKLPFGKLYQSWYFFQRVYNVIFVFKRLAIKEMFLRK